MNMPRVLSSYKPPKMWIDGKCFELRKLKKKQGKSNDVNSMPEIKETLNNQYEIEQGDEGKLYTKFRLPSLYYAKLCSFSDLKVTDIQKSTKTSINIPRNDGAITIIGDSQEDVVEARDLLHSIIGEIRNRSIAMQFVSIPTLSDEIITNFNKFKEAVLNEEHIKGMHESIFQSPQKLHLTIAVFVLMDNTEKEEAIQALEDYKINIFEPLIKKHGPIKIKVQGIDCMNKNFQKVDVLYAKAHIMNENEEFNLQNIVNGISEHFYNRGLLKSYQQNVKVHITAINTKYRKEPNSPRKSRWGKQQSIDATKIMDKYKDFYFGECLLDSIRLSLISTVGEDGFYKSIAIINAE